MFLSFVAWEDTVRFHAKLFRSFLHCFLDAHSNSAWVWQGSERVLAVIGQRLADVTGVHDPLSHQESPLGRHNDTVTRCPPRRRYEAASLTSFATSPTYQPMSAPPGFVAQPINITHGLYDKTAYVTVRSDLRGLGWGGYDGFLAGVFGWFLVWLPVIIIIVCRSSRATRAQSAPTRNIHRPQTVAVDTTTNAGKLAARPMLQDHLSIQNRTQSFVTGIVGDADVGISMPGTWFQECRMQNVLEMPPDPVFAMMSCFSRIQWAWDHFLGTTLFSSVSSALVLVSNEVAIVGHTFESRAYQGSESNQVDLDTASQTPVVPNKTRSENSLSVEHLHESDMQTHDQSEASVIDDAQPVVLAAPKDELESTSVPVMSGEANHILNQEGVYLDDDSAKEDQIDSTGDNVPIDIDSRRPGISTLDKKGGYRVLGRRQDGALSDTGYPLPLRRSRSVGRRCNIFDDCDDMAGDIDPYWTEQVNARLSSAHPSRDGSSECSFWLPPEGRGDESGNWRIRQASRVGMPASTSENPRVSKSRRHSSPPLTVNTMEVLSERALGDGGPRGVYVVPQKRGRMADGRCWSPSSPRLSDRQTGLGFFPFRETPSLLTPEAWRPGCLHIPDAPADESRQAEAWWDGLSLNSIGGGMGHEQGQGGQLSWRDRYENNPASRRFHAVHRRAMTGG